MSDAVPVGSQLGQYTLEEVIGEGATGVVYRARRGDSSVEYAVKVLRRSLLGDRIVSRRFAREARVATRVRGRNLVAVVDAGEVDGHAFLAAEYASGGSLDRRLEASGTLSLIDVASVVKEVARGLETLHENEIIHRDVKPSNIMFRASGDIALADFGLAKGPAYSVLTQPGMVTGTVDYLAPELIRGEDATPASDVYALGCTVYECLVGRPPFYGRSVFEAVTAHLDEEPEDPAALRADLSPGLAFTVMRALAKNPADRPPTAAAFAAMAAAD